MKKDRWMNWMAPMFGLLAAGAWCSAQEPALKVGDPAPKLQVAKWVQGDPVTQFERDKAYIVEFWATWCGPCRVSIPHLNEIYTKFKDKSLVVIGQNCWEHDESLVEPFVKKMGEKMTYRVALDDKNGTDKGKMAQTWMEAAGQNGIPSAFLVDKQGTIAWIGHPMELRDEVIEQVIAGKFDIKKAAAEHDAAIRNRGELARFASLLRQRDFKTAGGVASDLSDGSKDNAMLQNQLAWDLLTARGNTEPNLELLDRIATRANDASGGKDANILDTLARVKFMLGKKDAAIALQEKAVSLAEDAQRAALRQTLRSYQEGKLPPAN